jgi:hypothetical protein
LRAEATNVDLMSVLGHRPPRYLVEWYGPEQTEERLDRAAAMIAECAASISAGGSPVELLTMLAVPTDEVVFGVFAAGTADLVAQTCQEAGVPAQRLTAAVDAHIARKRP